MRLSSTDGPAEIIRLREDRLVVGRSRECDLVLPDVLLSRRHAELYRTARDWLVRDLGSMNGTRVNGARIEEARVLHDGDVVTLAGWSLAFFETEPPRSETLKSDHGARVHDITSIATKSGLDLSDRRRHGRLLGVLTRAAGAFVASATTDEVLDTLLSHLLDAIPARRGAVALVVNDPPAPVVVAVRPGEDESSMTIDPAVAERVLTGRSALLAPRVPAPDDGALSVICAPLWFTGPEEGTDRVVGLVYLEAQAEPTPFESEHLGLVSAVANLAASRLESVRLREETADMRRLEEDLRGAARIQESLLPEELPSVEGWDVGGSSRLCSAVGADYYDFAVEGDELLFAVGDVAGKGLAAALLMAALRAAVRALWAEPLALPYLVSRINENLLQTLPPNRYATLVLARLKPATGELRYVNAGHSAPVLVRAEGPAERLDEGGTILGVFPDIAWDEGRVSIAPGDTLIGLSDGVVQVPGVGVTPEAVDAEVRRTPGGAAEILSALQSAADTALGREQREDDHTFVVLKRL